MTALDIFAVLIRPTCPLFARLGPIRFAIATGARSSKLCPWGVAGSSFSRTEQDRNPCERTDDPPESQPLPSRSQAARRREKFPQGLHSSYLLSVPVRLRPVAASALEVKIEQ